MSEEDVMRQVAVIMLHNHQLKLQNEAMRTQIEETVTLLRELQAEIATLRTRITY